MISTGKPSIRNPVFSNDAPRTTKYPRPNGVRPTPGCVATTRVGSPNVPGTVVSSSARNEMRVAAPGSWRERTVTPEATCSLGGGRAGAEPPARGIVGPLGPTATAPGPAAAVPLGPVPVPAVVAPPALPLAREPGVAAPGVDAPLVGVAAAA